MKHPICASFVLLLILFLFLRCDNFKQKQKNEEIVAEVYDKKLFLSDLLKLIPPSAPPEDSLARANAYIEQWIRENLLLNEAEKNIPKDLDIQKLIEDYRSSLLRLHFEKKLVEENLDTSISDTEMASFYEDNKLQYLLKEPIILVNLLILKANSVHTPEAHTNWTNNDWEAIDQMCSSGDCMFYQKNNQWLSMGTFRNIISENVMRTSSVIGKKKIHEKTNEFEYYIKVDNFIDKNETPPLEFIQDQLTKVILHKRKRRIIQDLTEKLYETESRKHNVKVHSRS